MKDKINIIKISLSTIVMMLICANISFAGEAWEIVIRTYINDAEKKLMIGQAPDARDGIDDIYDIQAALSNDVEAYIELEGQEFWKDIRMTCERPCSIMWNIYIESELIGQTVGLEWDPLRIPDDVIVTMTDTLSGTVIDMSMEGGMSYQNTGERSFVVEVSKE